jgi:hypothetical protein
MKKVSLLLFMVLAFTAVVAVSGCRTQSGSREFIPGKGWVPND